MKVGQIYDANEEAISIARDEGYKEGFDEGFNKGYDYSLVENRNKFPWHDLRKNPDDLPTKDGFYAVAIDYDGIEIGFGYWETMFGYGSGWSCLVPEKQCVVGWKEIEPFEVKE